MEKIRLLVASDDLSLSRGLSAIFGTEKKFEVMGSFSFREAINKSIELQPDAVLVNLCGDLLANDEYVTKIKKGCPCSLIFVLMENEQIDNLYGLIKGIDGIIPKGIMRGCLVKTLELACQAGVFFFPASLKKKVAGCNLEKNTYVHGSSDLELNHGEALTKREGEILQLMAQNFSNRQIAKKLYISEPTVKTHVSNILRKMGMSSRTEAIILSYKQGLVEQQEDISMA